MSKLSKNLIFISEKSEIKYDVSSNLVRLYMNRSIIDEDDQFEILDVIQFIDTKSWKYYMRNDDMRSCLKRKIDKHSNIASEVMKRSFRAQNLETHLIVGFPIPRILDGFLWTERSRYYRVDLPLLIEECIISLVKSNLISNKLGKLSSYTVLNEWKNRRIKEWEVKRRSVMDLDQASYGRPNLKMSNINKSCSEGTIARPLHTIDQYVD